MTVGSFLASATAQLSAAGIPTARLDVLVLLEDYTGQDRALLLAHPEAEINPDQLRKLHEQIDRRAGHIPLAYIRGKTEFYGRDFAVNEHVLEPRPESETMIDLLKKIVHGDSVEVRLVDIGSGSGCLGITAALELGLPTVDFIDIDPKTLDIARQNAVAHGVSGTFMCTDMLEDPSHGPYDIILANLPYVPDSFHINEAAQQEPNIAIFGGPDGLDLYRRLFKQLHSKSWQCRYVLTEALPPQHEQLVDIASKHGFRLHASDDFIQLYSPVK